jgi:hypothetical protein
MRNHVERFLILFKRLKVELNYSLRNLKWLPGTKPEMAELCYQLDDTHRQLSRFIANQPTKSSIVPSIFQKNWDEYGADYQPKVEEIARFKREQYERELEKELFELFRQLREKAKEKGQSEEEFLEEITGGFEKGMSFNPIEDDAASLLEDLFYLINTISDSPDFLPGVVTDKHIGALNYFEKVIGINFHEINKRWGKAPNLFMSEKITKKTDKLVEMYNEAVKSYIYGLNVSATAMCRALLEHILINYYGLQKDDLVKVVSLAENRFKRLKALNLHRLRKDGNDVMHEYETKSRIEDAAVVDYLLTIQALVNAIPEK